jgi:hypothetical protein
MTKLVKTMLVCGFASAMVANSAFAAAVVITLDENGNGNATGLQATPVPIGASIQTDPSGDTGLFYDFGPIIAATGANITTGDVVINNVAGTAQSDLLHFVNSPGQQGIFFFSEDDGSGDFADGPVPVAASGSPVINETGVDEVNTSAVWRPTVAGQPGFVTIAPGGVFYNAISDFTPIVPEPGTLALFGVAGGMLALFWRQRSVRA